MCRLQRNMFRSRLPVVCACLCLLALLPAWAQDAAKGPGIIQAPAGAVTPDVASDRNNLHMVYGLENNAYYVRSRDRGKTFAAPVKLNGPEGATTMGERGPKLAVGQDRVIHVVWQDHAKPDTPAYTRYARSLDGGRTFSKPVAVSEMAGVQGSTLAVDDEGHVAVFWHVKDELEPAVPHATWVSTTRSTDNGQTFGKNERVSVTDATSLASARCMMRARMGLEGNVYLAFRSAEGNIRDIYVLKGRITENQFTALRVSQDNWLTETCPMNGPEITLDATGRVVCAYASRNQVGWAYSNKELTNFSRRFPAPDGANNAAYATAVMNRRAEILLVWQVGPIGPNGTATVKWAIYGMDGAFSGRQGTIGTTTSITRATAFVSGDENFYIVTTAKE